MDVLKNWKLNESLENIVNVADEAQKNFVLNNHEYKYVMENENNLQRSQRLIKMVSYYNDNLDTFLDILRTTENKSLAEKISEKRDRKTEFVFIIKEKKTLLCDEKEVRKHNSFCKIPRQFIYEESINDAIAKVKERYKCRKPVADILYVTIDRKFEYSEILFSNSSARAVYEFLKEMHNIFNENTEIKIILFGNHSNDNVNFKVLCPCFLTNIEMYVIKEEENKPLKDLEMCENIMSMLSKIPEKKVIFCNTALVIIKRTDTSNIEETVLDNYLETTKVFPIHKRSKELKNSEHEVVKLVNSCLCHNDSEEYKEKLYMIYFQDGFDKESEVRTDDYIETLFKMFSDTQKRFIILIRKHKKHTISMKVTIKGVKNLKNREYVTFYVIDESDWENFMTSLKDKRDIEKLLEEKYWQQKKLTFLNTFTTGNLQVDRAKKTKLKLENRN